jgi:hypothetical protein
MSAPIVTSKVVGRRDLHFDNLDDIIADVEQLASAGEPRALGNWSAGQVVQHLAIAMNNSIDGFGHALPAPVRMLIRLFFKHRFLDKTMSAGFQLPASAAKMLPPATTWDEGRQNIRRAVGRLKTETRRSPHPAIGALSPDEWVRLHCRHSELHLSFLISAT